MILQALCAYAQDAELVKDPAFETRPVDYKIEIDESGRFIGMTSLDESVEIEKKNKKGEIKKTVKSIRREMPSLPRGPKRASLCAWFLVDKAEYVLGQWQYFFGKGNKKDKTIEQAQEEAKNYLDHYRNTLRQVADPVPEPLTALLRFLDNPEEREAADRALAGLEKEAVEGAAEKAPNKRGSKILVPAVNGEFLHENPAIREAWKAHIRKSGQADEGSSAQAAICLVTGSRAPIARLHPNITGIPGSLQNKACIVSFNAQAFESHGQSQGNNAPISENAALLYTAALNDLISKKKNGGRKSAVQLDEQTLVAFWTRESDELTEILGEAVDEFWEEKEKETASLRERLEAFGKGRESKGGQPNAFYALTLSANGPRAIIRDWIETTAADISDNIKQWFEDLSLCSNKEFFPLKRLLRSLEATPDASDRRGLPSALTGQIFRSIMLGMPLPKALLTKAVQRMRLPHNPMRPFDLQYRTALIKAALIRHPSLHLQRKELTVSLNPENHEPAYLLGRLFAVLEMLQSDAVGSNLNATIRDRYYGAASTTPAAVFGQLLRLSMNHVSKLGKKGNRLEKMKSEIMDSLEAKPMPKTLKLEEQGLFALGYYQQRAKIFEKKEESEVVETFDSNAA